MPFARTRRGRGAERILRRASRCARSSTRFQPPQAALSAMRARRFDPVRCNPSEGRRRSSHDDRAFEPVNALGEDREETIHDLVPLFGVELLGKIHRALHVGEENRHLLALAFEGGSRRKDLLSEVFRSVRARVAEGRRNVFRRRTCCLRQARVLCGKRPTAPITEPRARWGRGTTSRRWSRAWRHTRCKRSTLPGAGVHIGGRSRCQLPAEARGVSDRTELRGCGKARRPSSDSGWAATAHRSARAA